MEIRRKSSSDFTRIFDILTYQEEKYPNARALNSLVDGTWKGFSIGEIRAKVDAISCWFISNNYQKGDKIIFVPMIGNPQWVMIDYACQQVGLITVPIHPTSSVHDIEVIVTETEPKLCITADASLYQVFLAAVEKLKAPLEVSHLVSGVEGYSQGFQSHSPTPELLSALGEIKAKIKEDDVQTILYTSGSSGTPKGVVLTHRNIIHNIKAILTLLPLEPTHRVLSFLPFSHILERMACYGYMAFGVSLYFSHNKENFASDFNSVRPFFCTSVPRVLEKLYDFMEEQSMQRNWVKRKLITWAMDVGKQYGHGGRIKPWLAIKLFFARVLVLNRWRKKLGGKIRYMVVGAASLRPEIGKMFTASGIHVIEGYGMTETAPLITINRYEPGLNRFGTVGMTIPGIEVRIDEPDEQGEGEILVKGPNVMSGYFKRPELTQAAFTEDGWFRTGDIGKFVHNRFLKITDRKKDIFKTSAGKYIAPQPLQNHFKKSPFIERCLIIGFQRPYVTALFVPHMEVVHAWCLQENIHWTSPQFMVHNIKVRAKIQQEVDQLNESLPNIEQVKNFVLCPTDWTTERGELTNTLKPVRQKLMSNYQAEIEKMYE
jgi:long-chain acyl-CoA synthetase